MLNATILHNWTAMMLRAELEVVLACILPLERLGRMCVHCIAGRLTMFDALFVAVMHPAAVVVHCRNGSAMTMRNGTLLFLRLGLPHKGDPHHYCDNQIFHIVW